MLEDPEIEAAEPQSNLIQTDGSEQIDLPYQAASVLLLETAQNELKMVKDEFVETES